MLYRFYNQVFKKDSKLQLWNISTNTVCEQKLKQPGIWKTLPLKTCFSFRVLNVFVAFGSFSFSPHFLCGDNKTMEKTYLEKYWMISSYEILYVEFVFFNWDIINCKNSILKSVGEEKTSQPSSSQDGNRLELCQKANVTLRLWKCLNTFSFSLLCCCCCCCCCWFTAFADGIAPKFFLTSSSPDSTLSTVAHP